MLRHKFTIITTIIVIAVIGFIWSFIDPIGNGAGPNEGKVPSAILTPTPDPAPSADAPNLNSTTEGKIDDATAKAKQWLSEVQKNLDNWGSKQPSTGSRTNGKIGGAWNGVTYDAAKADQRLGALTVAAPGSMSGYSRERFTHWISSNVGPDCDTRDAILLRDGTGTAMGRNCAISGTWVDPYTGTTSTTARDFDIDHVVPLAAAWRAGANTWTDAKREQYANDKLVLLTTGSGPNREKGDRTADQWKPANQSDWCSYAVRTVEIKDVYHLTVTGSEKSALSGMLDTCPA